MPLAGQMKLRTFLILASAVGVVALGGIGVGMWWVGGEVADAAAEAKADRLEREAAALQERLDRRQAAREAFEREQGTRQPQGIVTNPVDVAGQAADLRAAAPPADVPTGRPVDDAVMRHLGRGLGTSKKKDVTSGMPYKVNVYQDAGNAQANRAKIDLDRDEKWDEKWTWADGTITRKVSPDDDDNYTVEEVWGDGSWRAR